MADELVAAGLAAPQQADTPERGATEILAVLAVVPTVAATAITLLQGPATWADLASRLRKRGLGTKIEVRAPKGTLSIVLDDVPDDDAVAQMVETFLEQARDR